MLLVAAQWIITVLFMLTVGVLSYAFCRRRFPSAPFSVCLTASCIVFAWLLSLGFALLMTLHAFTAWGALSLLVIGLGGVWVRYRGRGRRIWVDWMRDERTFIHDSISSFQCDVPLFIVIGGFLWLCVLFVIRGLCLPILGWDSFTNHALKAGLWVQNGGWTILDAPGGWEYYRSYFGGGEVFIAWAMVFFKSDFLAALPDLFFWLLLSLSLFCIARQYGMRARTAIFINLAFACSPVFTGVVGSGNIDICANACLFCGLLFVLRALHARNEFNLYAAAAALGVAASIKVNMLATIALVSVPALIILCMHGETRVRTYVTCVLLFMAPLLPWLIFNHHITGYPLGCVPLHLGPITLGEAPPNLVWFFDCLTPSPEAHTLVSEFHAVSIAFGRYRLFLFLSVLGLPGLIEALRNRNASYWIGLCVVIAAALLFFSPSFTAIRLRWPNINGRFLMPVVILPVLIGLSADTVQRYKWLLVEAISTVCVITGVYEYFRIFVFGGDRVELVFLMIASTLLVGIAYFMSARRTSRYRWGRVEWVGIILTCLAIGVACERFRVDFRADAYARCSAANSFVRYWTPALEVLTSYEEPAVIAFTLAAQPISHRTMVAPFLGAYLENQVVYVSPEKDGVVRKHGLNFFEETHPDYNVWLDALVQKKVSHLLCFDPPSIELEWAEMNPAEFIRKKGISGEWGFFELNHEVLSRGE